jgi:hypothetical protein
MTLLRAAAAIAAMTLLVSACGADDPQTTSTVEMDMADTADGAMDDMADTADGAMDDMADTADGAMDDMSDDEMAADHEHDHEEVTLVEWPADRDLPTVSVTADPSRPGRVEVTFDVAGFSVVGGDVAEIPDGSGHLHVTVDGQFVAMIFEPSLTLEGFEPGVHTLTVDLAAGDHGTYASNGQALSYAATFEIPGEVSDADVVIELEVDADGVVGGIARESASVGDIVEIRIASSIAEELHVHVYDVVSDLTPGETTAIRFTADIPGVFEVELEGAGLQILSLEVS